MTNSTQHTAITTLPTTAPERKQLPIFNGVMRYFPDAIAAIAEVSRVGNDQHNPGQPLHWDRSKSTDELDALARHLLDAGTLDVDGIRHSAKVAWRALANLQKEIENAQCQKPEQLFYLHTECGMPAFQILERPLVGNVVDSSKCVHLNGSPISRYSPLTCDSCGKTLDSILSFNIYSA